MTRQEVKHMPEQKRNEIKKGDVSYLRLKSIQ